MLLALDGCGGQTCVTTYTCGLPIDGGGATEESSAPDATSAERPDTSADASTPDGDDAEQEVGDGEGVRDAQTDASDVCPPAVYVAAMTPTMMPMPVATTSTGTARIVLECDGTTARYTFHLRMEGTSALTFAHVHRTDGTSVVIVFGPQEAGPDRSGTVTLSPSEAALLREGNLFADAHTQANPGPGGEIRGWLTRE